MKRFIVLLACIPLALGLSCTSVDPSAKYPNMVADMDPISAGTVEVEFDRMFSSKLNKVEVDTIFYPRLNEVALEFRYEFVRYRQFWNERGRQQFAEALNRYKEDYTSRNLVNKYSKSRALYGKTKGRVEWETFKYTTTHRSAPNIEMGYRFRGDMPFFATLQRSAKEEGVSGDGPELESLQINMYFTRAQAEALVQKFDQAYLSGLLGKTREEPQPEAATEDSYLEYEEQDASID